MDNQSRYIAFFDECGDHSLSKIDRDFPLFLLSTVIIKREDYVTRVIPDFAKFKFRFWNHEGVNLHSRDIHKAFGDFSFLQIPEQRASFLEHLNELVRELPFTLFITAIRKNEYLKRYGANALNPYDIALEYTFERVLHFMEGIKETYLPVIAEARGRQEDAELEAAFYKLMTSGNYYNPAERFKRLSCPISFRSKLNNICGIQLADLCAYPSARHILKPNQTNKAFEIFEAKIYNRKQVSGWKVYP